MGKSIPTLKGDEMEKLKRFGGEVKVAERISDGFYRVDLKIMREGGRFITQVPQAYFLPVTPRLWPREGMSVSFLAWYPDSLSREELTIGGIRLSD